ncbi:hypothetical protein DDB_G0267632 [Dictyostelium discoideum AX4]|uniref:AB hydrolase-1 domain-containing protein n=1 Tax=Dictyostelium discoideum TaxID=44689 RepID=Q55GK7_DICDI|nr:hypothetical protein DDB_G0267632 [Dictyostelium discoideum AX4]EAL73269.1 hypothetical protein DDB_G0267632 [Dictyostelium discoideum AX4]|eukprot:XP_647177.1 hypothetical protein DDB_G0267632 [Dictyostelium discoideum AX4]
MENSNIFINVKNRNQPFKMNYKVFGDGEEKCLFIMGLLLGGKYWLSTIKYFLENNPNKYSICIYDHVGVGESEFNGVSSINDFASDANELIEHLKWEKVNIVGVSMGSSIAYELSLMAPSIIKTLNLVSFPPNINYGFLFQKGAQQLYLIDYIAKKNKVDPSNYLIDLLYSQSFLNSPSRIKQYGNNREFILPLLSKMYNERKTISPSIIISTMFAMIKYKIKPYNKIKEKVLNRPFPIVMFFGTHDKFIDCKRVIKTYDIIQPNLIYICENSGHSLQLEDVLQFNKVTQNFFNYNLKSNNSRPEFLNQKILKKNELTNNDEYTKRVFKESIKDINFNNNNNNNFNNNNINNNNFLNNLNIIKNKNLNNILFQRFSTFSNNLNNFNKNLNLTILKSISNNLILNLKKFK